MSEIVRNCFPALRETSIIDTVAVETISTIVNTAATVLAKTEGEVLQVWTATEGNFGSKVKGRLRRPKVLMMTTISMSSTMIVMTMMTVMTVTEMMTVTTATIVSTATTATRNVRSMTVKT